MTKKTQLHVRIDCSGLASIEELFLTKAPRTLHVGRFVSFKATVVRTGFI